MSYVSQCCILTLRKIVLWLFVFIHLNVTGAFLWWGKRNWIFSVAPQNSFQDFSKTASQRNLSESSTRTKAAKISNHTASAAWWRCLQGGHFISCSLPWWSKCISEDDVSTSSGPSAWPTKKHRCLQNISTLFRCQRTCELYISFI